MDSNLSKVTWNNDNIGIIYSYKSCPSAPCIHETFTTYRFFEFNLILNSSNSVLVLVFCNNNCLTMEMLLKLVIPID